MTANYTPNTSRFAQAKVNESAGAVRSASVQLYRLYQRVDDGHYVDPMKIARLEAKVAAAAARFQTVKARHPQTEVTI